MDAEMLAAALAGAILGAGLASAAWWWLRSLSQAKPSVVPAYKLTSTWRLSELLDPTVVAQDVNVEVPAGAQLLVSGQVDADAFSVAQVRQVPSAPGAFAIDRAASKALLFLGGLHPNALAIQTTDRELIGRLAAQAKSLHAQSEPYLERRPLAELAGRTGLDVETQGTIQDVLPYHGAFLLRLEQDGHSLGVVVEKEPSELKGARVLVRGRLAKDKGGYPVLQATDLRRIQ